ncbi:MAG: GAF domain-containing sensor histidine kinase, partial [Nitrososphaeraceae archaeon]|nr:GAF domain-containing sensor histidine kinase [Nitrososphaeraceae archaeon]
MNGSNGEPRWIEDNSITILDSNNKAERRIGFLCDVSNQLKDEKVRKIIADILEAANSKKNLSDLFEFIHTSVKKLMKADNFYIAYYDEQSNTLSFPYFIDENDDDSSPKKLGKGLTEYVLRTGKSALVDKKLDRELILKGETELLGPQSEIWLGVPLKIKDKVVGVLVVQDYNDPTTYTVEDKQILDVISYPISRAVERKMDEEERNENMIKLQQLNKSKDQLFSLISNDLRSPFNSLLGFADVLSNEFDSLTQRDIKEYLNIINESSKTLFWMTNNLLHYSRMQLGKFSYKPEIINLEKVVRNSIEFLIKNIKAKDLVVKNQVSKEFYIRADEEMLSISLNNLISNAVKFSISG